MGWRLDKRLVEDCALSKELSLNRVRDGLWDL